MNAREYLANIEYLDGIIRGKISEIRQLRWLAESCTVPTDREPGTSSGVTDRVGEIVAKIYDLESELSEIVAEYIQKKQECVSLIESIRPPIYYTVLHKFHVEGKSLVEIAEEIGYEYHYVCDLHRKAIAEVQKKLDEK